MSNVVTTNGVQVTSNGIPVRIATRVSLTLTATASTDASVFKSVNFIDKLFVKSGGDKVTTAGQSWLSGATLFNTTIDAFIGPELSGQKVIHQSFSDSVSTSVSKQSHITKKVSFDEKLQSSIKARFYKGLFIRPVARLEVVPTKFVNFITNIPVTSNGIPVTANGLNVEAGGTPFDTTIRATLFTTFDRTQPVTTAGEQVTSDNNTLSLRTPFVPQKSVSQSFTTSVTIDADKQFDFSKEVQLSINETTSIEARFFFGFIIDNVSNLSISTDKFVNFITNIPVTSNGIPVTANGIPFLTASAFDTTTNISTETLLEQQKITPLQIALQYVADVSLASKFDKLIQLVIEQLQVMLLEQDKFVSDTPATFNTIFTEKQSLKILEVQKDIGVDSRAGDKIFVSKAVDLALNILQEQRITLDELKSVLKDLTIDQTIELLFTVVRTRPSLVLGPIGIASRMRLEPSNTQRSELDPSNTQLSRIDFSGERKKLIVKSAQNKKFLAIRRIFSGAERYVVPEEE